MQSSCLLCISTLLESGNRKRHAQLHHAANPPLTLCFGFTDYSKMFELKDATTGDQLFETIAITLVCDDCLKTDRTCHFHLTPGFFSHRSHAHIQSCAHRS